MSTTRAVNDSFQNKYHVKNRCLQFLNYPLNEFRAINLLEITCKQVVIYSTAVNCTSFLARGQWWGKGFSRARASANAGCLALISLLSP
jgi:hypothetical protein